TGGGVRLREVYVGPEGVLTGSARTAQEERERRLHAERASAIESARALTERKMRAIESQMAVLQADLEAERIRLSETEREESDNVRRVDEARAEMAKSRGSDLDG